MFFERNEINPKKYVQHPRILYMIYVSVQDHEYLVASRIYDGKVLPSIYANISI